jgi:hypothetical protein
LCFKWLNADWNTEHESIVVVGRLVIVAVSLQKYNTDGGCRNEKLPHPQPDIFNENGVITKQDPIYDELEAVDVLPQDLQEATPNISK